MNFLSQYITFDPQPPEGPRCLNNAFNEVFWFCLQFWNLKFFLFWMDQKSVSNKAIYFNKKSYNVLTQYQLKNSSLMESIDSYEIKWTHWQWTYLDSYVLIWTHVNSNWLMWIHFHSYGLIDNVLGWTLWTHWKWPHMNSHGHICRIFPRLSYY